MIALPLVDLPVMALNEHKSSGECCNRKSALRLCTSTSASCGVACRGRSRTSQASAVVSVFGFSLLAPLVVPEVILGLSLLLLFVTCQSWLGFPSRGMLTIILAHATFGACFVSVLVRAQLAGFDRALEEAALDLGARPWTVLIRITLPGISPALLAG